MSTVKALFHSRKFMIAFTDALTSIVLYGVSTFLPDWSEHVKFLIVVLQPVTAILIASIAYEDGQLKSNTSAIPQ